MSESNLHFQKILCFMEKHERLMDCNMVDFFTEDLWNKCLPEKLKTQLEQIDINNGLLEDTDNYEEINQFTETTKILSLESYQDIIGLKDVLTNNFTVKTKSMNPKVDFMNAKKCHEVGVLGEVVAQIAKSTCSLVIDAGAGKAYLSTYLSENYGIPVLAIDSSNLCHKGAIYRQKKMQKKKKQALSMVRYVVEEINDTTDYNSMITSNFPDWNVNKNLILTGLHCCGLLVHSIINIFLNARDMQFLCVVPCCYHLVNDSLSKRLNISKNARMLAQQSLERVTGNENSSLSLFHRALLQVLLHSMKIYDAKVGRGGPQDCFSSYAKWGLLKIGVSVEKIPSVTALEQMYQNFIHLKKNFDKFQLIRIHLSRVVEAAIILDKIIFLQDSKQCSNVAVLRLFDPLLSPRCYAIFATK